MARKRADEAQRRYGGLIIAAGTTHIMAEGEGFEPPDLSINGFQDRRLRPLGHPSEPHASPWPTSMSSSFHGAHQTGTHRLLPMKVFCKSCF